MDGVGPFSTIGLSADDCIAILRQAEHQLESLQEALGC
jgi:hypothetical protein